MPSFDKCPGVRSNSRAGEYRAALRLRLIAGASFCVVLGACGGGGDNAGLQSASSAPPPTTPPTASPPPINYDTAEFRRSDGPDFHGADSAWKDGATGEGAIIAIIDSGIDSDSPEFDGRIHADSRDVVGNRSIDPEDDHGTNVALVAAGGRDNRGVLGIAFDAEVLALRADMPGSCGVDSPTDATLGCVFSDTAIAAGVDQAVASGAAVINLSLGGDAANPQLLSSIRDAAAAGLVIVVAAGNDGDGSEPGVDPDQPDAFATSLLEAGGGNVIIVGSVNENGDFSAFSNRAGDAASSYITARGERVCCVYQDGEMFVETVSGSEYVTLFSGTSFAAPQVSGAVALLAQAFPNLTGAEIVEILLETARDAGAAGIDRIYGTGILDIAAAFRPVGTTSLAGSGKQFALADDFAVGSAAMGDALTGADIGTIITDRYSRAFSVDLGARTRNAAQIERLRNAIGEGGFTRAAGTETLAFAVTVGEGSRAAGLGWSQELQLTNEEAHGARLIAASVAARIAPDMQIGFAVLQGARGLVAQMQAMDTQASRAAAFLIAPEAGGSAGYFESSEWAIATRRKVGGWGVILSAQKGDAWLDQLRRSGDVTSGLRERRLTSTIGIAADRSWLDLDARFAASWVGEEETVLGAHFNPLFGLSGADSLFLDASLAHRPGRDWRLGAAVRAGTTRARSTGSLARGGSITGAGWSFDVTRYGFVSRRDTLGLRISQPFRVEAGAIRFDLPTAYDYSSRTATVTRQSLDLAPKGREIMGELAWSAPLPVGTLSTSLFFRNQPGHFANAPDDLGVTLRFGSRF